MQLFAAQQVFNLAHAQSETVPRESDLNGVTWFRSAPPMIPFADDTGRNVRLIPTIYANTYRKMRQTFHIFFMS